MNHTNFGRAITTWTGGTFGKVQSARDPRIMQFAPKYTF
jgi:hypothetical protein